MSHIYFIEGPVGAGKSTYAKAMAKRGQFTHIALDEWFVRLFSPDRPHINFVTWYIERKDRLIDLILSYAHSILESGQSVALELGLIQRALRVELFRKMEQEGISFSVHVLDVAKDIRYERVQRRNREQGKTFSMVVPDHIFEAASNMWEAPDEFELEDFNFIFPTSAEVQKLIEKYGE